VGTNQVRDAESILFGTVYAIGEPQSYGNQPPKVRVTVNAGNGMQDVNVTTDLAAGLTTGATVAWVVRFGVFTPPANDRFPDPQPRLICVFIRPVVEGDLDTIAGALPTGAAAK
jgi:hypothetical protein